MISAFLLAACAWADAAAQAEFAACIDRLAAAAAEAHDATYRLHQGERVGSRWLTGTIDVKLRGSDVFLDMTDSAQRVLYRGASWNDGKLMADPGRFLPTVSLDIDGRLAMMGQRHSIRMVGFAPVVHLFVADAARISARSDWAGFDVRDEGIVTEYGEPARCFKAHLPKAEDPAFYADEVRVCINERTSLPAHIQAWDVIDGQLLLVEDYGYEGIQANVGLTDADFDPVALGF